MSKRLFILGSLLETHPRRASSQARVRTPVVVKAEIRRQGGGALGRRAVGPPIRPFAQQRLDEPLGLAVRSRGVGSGEAVPDLPRATHTSETTGAIAVAVVGEQAAHDDAAPPKPPQRVGEEGGTGPLPLRAADFDVRPGRLRCDAVFVAGEADVLGSLDGNGGWVAFFRCPASLGI